MSEEESDEDLERRFYRQDYANDEDVYTEKTHSSCYDEEGESRVYLDADHDEHLLGKAKSCPINSYGHKVAAASGKKSKEKNHEIKLKNLSTKSDQLFFEFFGMYTKESIK